MSKEQKIKASLAYCGKSQASVAKEMGMTPQNFGVKLKRDTFTEAELRAIAEIMGAEFIPCAFEFPDGTKI